MGGSVSHIIMQQLGGDEFAMMTGLSAIIRYRNGLVVRFGEGAEEGLNLLRVRLDEMDTYSVDFGTVAQEGELPDLLPSAVWPEQYCYEGVYNDALRDLFKEVTGFEPILPRASSLGGSLGDHSVEL